MVVPGGRKLAHQGQTLRPRSLLVSRPHLSGVERREEPGQRRVGGAVLGAWGGLG